MKYLRIETGRKMRSGGYQAAAGAAGLLSDAEDDAVVAAVVAAVVDDAAPALLSAEVLPDESALSALDLSAPALPLLVPLPLLRKSVTYQPLPLSWKPAAVTCFFMAGLPQDSQSVSGASEIFCRISLAKPQASQRYA